MKDVAKVGWNKRALGEVCRLVNGRAYKKTELLDDGPYPVLRVGNFFTNNHWYYSDLELDEDKYCDDGDLLYAWSASFGPRIWSGGKVIYHYHIWKVLPSEHIDRDFLYYFFEWDKELIKKEQGAGTTMIHVSKGSMEARAILLPPLEEQQRIVAVLDKAFEGLASASAHAEANLQNARELFKCYAGSVFRPYEDAEESAYATTVGAVCDIQSGAGFPLQYQGEKNGDFPFYKVSDMNLPGNEWELHAANHYVSDRVRLELRARIFPRDSIVFPKVGGAIATNKKRIIQIPGCVDNNIMGLIPDQGKVVPEYLHEWLRAFDIYEFSNKANPPSITQGTVSCWPLRVPSRDEQMQVVATAVGLREHTEILRKKYIERLQDIASLRQSLLQKAFTGELT